MSKKQQKILLAVRIGDRIKSTCGMPDDFMEYLQMTSALLEGQILITGNRPNRYLAAHPCSNWQKLTKAFKEIVE